MTPTHKLVTVPVEYRTDWIDTTSEHRILDYLDRNLTQRTVDLRIREFPGVSA